jgi:ATP/maltotriose-dependent transcriptional regulator MalT
MASKTLAVALESARAAEDRGAEVEALRLLSVLARHEGHNRRALECCEQALHLLGEATSAHKQRGTILLSQGDVLRQMGRLKEAHASYAEALVIYRRLGIKRLQALTLNAMGLAVRAVGDYEDAVALFRRSLRLDQEINDSFRVGHKLCNLGVTYAEAGDVERAIGHLSKSAEVNQQLGDRRGLEETLIALLQVFLSAGAKKEAARILEQLDKLPRGAENRETAVRGALARADLALADLDAAAAAADTARQAVELARAASMLAAEAQGEARLALAEARQGHAVEAREALGRVSQLLDQAGQVERADELHLLCARASEALGDLAAAARSFSRAKAEVDGRRARMKSAAFREKYDAQPRIREIEQGVGRLEGRVGPSARAETAEGDAAPSHGGSPPPDKPNA